MKSRLLAGLAALVLAIAGTLMLVNYVSNADRRAQESLQPVDVVVVDSAGSGRHHCGRPPFPCPAPVHSGCGKGRGRAVLA